MAVPSPPPPPHKVDSFDDSHARRKQYQNVSTLEKTVPMDSDPKNTQILEVITRRDQLASKARKKEEEPRGRGRGGGGGRGGRGGRGRGRGAASTKKKDTEQEDESGSEETEEPPKRVPRKKETETSKPSGSQGVPTTRVFGKSPPEQVDVPKKRAKKANDFMTAEPINYTNQKIGEIREFVELLNTSTTPKWHLMT